MKNNDVNELMVNHNYFIRMVINEILGLLVICIILTIIAVLLVLFMKDSIWIVLTMVFAYIVLLFIKVGKIRSVHNLVTGIEDRIVKNSAHNTSSNYWKL